jgi:hypothetical protein
MSTHLAVFLLEVKGQSNARQYHYNIGGVYEQTHYATNQQLAVEGFTR